MSIGQPALAMQENPFSLASDKPYRRWRVEKLAGYPTQVQVLRVKVKDPRALSDLERHQLQACCDKTNMVVYSSDVGGLADKDIPRCLGEQFGMQRLDNNPLADENAVTSLQVTPGKSGRGYIPYSNQRLSWHTDGYYNSPERAVRAFILHCVSPAAEGGENALLDPEIAYILLRDENPDYVRALMANDVLTIPANEEEGASRPAQTGPVFSIDPVHGSLHMRYTARTRSIEWKADSATQNAVRALERLLASDSPYIFRYRLAAGEGLLCNNVLHNRTAFQDDTGQGRSRLIYRARYYDRVRGTGVQSS